MRDFGKPISNETRTELTGLVEQVYNNGSAQRALRASDFAMEEVPDRIVAKEVEVRWDDSRLRVAATESDARPPFEWLYEVTANVGDTDYFKHYLVRTDDIVLAQRKVLTVIDDKEAAVMRADLLAALRAAG